MLVPVTPKMVFNSFSGKLPPLGYSSMLYRSNISGENDKLIANLTLLVVNPAEELPKRENIASPPLRFKIQISYPDTEQMGIVVLDPFAVWVDDEKCGVSLKILGEGEGPGYSYENPLDEVFPEELPPEMGDLNSDNVLNIQKCFFLASRFVLPSYVMKESA